MTGQPKAITFHRLMACDLVRQEASGKLIIIGVYSSDVVMPVLPGRIVLHFVGPTHANAIGPVPLKIRITLGDNAIVEADAIFEPMELGQAVSSLGPFPLQIAEEGRLAFQVSQSDGEWETLAEYDIRKGNAPRLAPA